MEFLYLLESIRFPVLDKLMLLITMFGEETAFLAVAIITFWCIDKNRGYYLMSVGFVGTIFNQFLKLLCRIPRPWVLDENFTIVEEAREAASGYSFPSGHSQSAVGTFGGLAATCKEKWLRVVCIAIAAAVPFSRMYLGVHTPADVLVGAGCAVVLIFGFRFVNRGKGIPVMFGVMAALSLCFLLFVEFFPFPADIDPHNYASGLKNAYTLSGCIFGMLIVYFVDQKWVNFPVKAIWWAQLLKVALGLGLVLAVKSGAKSLLNAAFGTSWGTFVRYMLIVLIAGIVWPLTFRWFSNLGKKDK